ncbi:MIT domain-containing protein 1-like isoform X2 [Bacillus rossius redtenbacheri]
MSQPGVESAASLILQRGVELDNKRRYTEALICYQEGLQLLVDMIKGVTDVQKKKYLRAKVEGYMSRAEKLKAHVEEEKESGKYHEQINIENDSTGHDYQKVFGRFLDEHVTQVHVEDPYIRNFHQCQNFLRLCELLVKSCINLKKVSLLTSLDGNGKDQLQRLESIKDDLHSRHILLTIDISDTLHDRQIRLSNGWIIKIGRGLDYFKPPTGKFSLGFFDYNFRYCHETVVDIFHSKDVRLL